MFPCKPVAYSKVKRLRINIFESETSLFNILLDLLCTYSVSVHTARHVQICHSSTMDMLEVYSKAAANTVSAQPRPNHVLDIP